MTNQTGIDDLEKKLNLIQEYININNNVEFEKMVLETNILDLKFLFIGIEICLFY